MASSKSLDLATLVSDLVGVVLPYAGLNAPYGFLLCYGQAVSRTTYSDLFNVIGTYYGSGNGSTTFNIPDMRGRVPAGPDQMPLLGDRANRLSQSLTGNISSSSGVISGLPTTAGLSVGMRASGPSINTTATIASIDSSTQVTMTANANANASGVNIVFSFFDRDGIGGAGGYNVHTLTTPQMPSHEHMAGTVITGRNTSTGGGEQLMYSGTTEASAATGGGQAHPNVQPTILLNYIIKT